MPLYDKKNFLQSGEGKPDTVVLHGYKQISQEIVHNIIDNVFIRSSLVRAKLDLWIFKELCLCFPTATQQLREMAVKIQSREHFS